MKICRAVWTCDYCVAKKSGGRRASGMNWSSRRSGLKSWDDGGRKSIAESSIVLQKNTQPKVNKYLQTSIQLPVCSANLDHFDDLLCCGHIHLLQAHNLNLLSVILQDPQLGLLVQQVKHLIEEGKLYTFLAII